jgi:hypothetical protein
VYDFGEQKSHCRKQRVNESGQCCRVSSGPCDGLNSRIADDLSQVPQVRFHLKTVLLADYSGLGEQLTTRVGRLLRVRE